MQLDFVRKYLMRKKDTEVIDKQAEMFAFYFEKIDICYNLCYYFYRIGVIDMNYSIKLNDIFELSGSDYVTIDKTEYNGSTYFFTNKLNGEEPTDKFVVFKDVGTGLVEEKKQEVLDVILKTFSNNMNSKIRTINSSKE